MKLQRDAECHTETTDRYRMPYCHTELPQLYRSNWHGGARSFAFCLLCRPTLPPCLLFGFACTLDGVNTRRVGYSRGASELGHRVNCGCSCSLYRLCCSCSLYGVCPMSAGSLRDTPLLVLFACAVHGAQTPCESAARRIPTSPLQSGVRVASPAADLGL